MLYVYFFGSMTCMTNLTREVTLFIPMVKIDDKLHLGVRNSYDIVKLRNRIVFEWIIETHTCL